MEVCTYEIYQKSDPRPLVKVVTPVIRFLANLCAGPDSETLTLSLVTSWVAGFALAHSSGHYLFGHDPDYLTLASVSPSSYRWLQ